jgi:plasmid replication initiation protein
MAKKKNEPIINLGNEDKLTVQKSKPLFSLWQSELTLAEFKILDTYLARIDSHKPEKRAVIFEKGKLEKLLGVQKINNKELEKRLKHLMGNVVKISDTDERKGFKLISLFEEAVAEQDDNGLWQVKLECTQKAMKYIFNVENLTYCRYKLKCIISIKSRYTYIMFIYLESRRRLMSWEVPLEELKKILKCDKEEVYKEFKYFNRKILKAVQKEMFEKTDCRYEYEPIREGKKVTKIKFTLESNNKYLTDDGFYDNLTEDFVNDNEELWIEALKPLEIDLDREQIEELRSVLVTIPKYKLPQSPANLDNTELQRYHYIDIKVKEIIRRSSKKLIKNKYMYLLSVIKKDSEEK